MNLETSCNNHIAARQCDIKALPWWVLSVLLMQLVDWNSSLALQEWLLLWSAHFLVGLSSFCWKYSSTALLPVQCSPFYSSVPHFHFEQCSQSEVLSSSDSTEKGMLRQFVLKLSLIWRQDWKYLNKKTNTHTHTQHLIFFVSRLFLVSGMWWKPLSLLFLLWSTVLRS